MKERIVVVVALIIFTMMMHPQRRGYASLISAGRGHFVRHPGQSANA